MLLNYLITAYRNMLKRKGYTLMNIVGLSVGICTFLTIICYVHFEFSYDTFHNESNQIYRVEKDQHKNIEPIFGMTLQEGALGPTLHSEFPEVENFVRVFKNTSPVAIGYNNSTFLEDNVHWVDSTFFNIFSYSLVSGDSKTALKDPYTVVISESIATKIFGNENPIGKTLMVSRKPYKITGVVKEPPVNTHFHFQYLFSYSTLIKEYKNWANDGWFWSAFHLYVKLKPGTDVYSLEQKMQGIYERHQKDILLKKGITGLDYHLRPMKDIHLQGHSINSELEVNGDIRKVIFILIIAIFILIISWVNYINLSTSKALERAKEVGLRKVFGARKSEFLLQFFLESALLNAFSVIFSLMLFVALPALVSNALNIDYFIFINAFKEWWFWMVVFCTFVISSIISGFYPALVLSSYKPITVIKGKFSKSAKGMLIRNGLVVIQYIISAILIAGVITIYKQLSYMKSQSVGFKIEDILVIRGPLNIVDSTYNGSLASFKEELLKYDFAKSVAATDEIPGRLLMQGRALRLPENAQEESVLARLFTCDYDFLDVFELKILAGRNFEETYGTDKKEALIINKSVSKKLNFLTPEDAIGKTILLNDNPHKIIGVIDDYHQTSLKEEYVTIAIKLNLSPRNYLVISLNNNNENKTLSLIKDTWKKYFPNDPLEYFYLDTFYEQQYKDDNQFGSLITLLAIIAILIASLGLWALSSYSTSLRTKEIGIRKVIGATMKDITTLLINYFLKLIALSLLISLPLSYLIFNNWLNNYAYRISLGWWFFIVPIISLLFITYITIGYHIYRASKRRAAEALKYE